MADLIPVSGRCVVGPEHPREELRGHGGTIISHRITRGLLGLIKEYEVDLDAPLPGLYADVTPTGWWFPAADVLPEEPSALAPLSLLRDAHALIRHPDTFSDERARQIEAAVYVLVREAQR